MRCGSRRRATASSSIRSPPSIQILSRDGETRHVNKAWERLWGATLADLANYNLRQDPQLVESGLMPTIENAFNGVPGLLPATLYYPDRTLPGVSSHQDPRLCRSAPSSIRCGAPREACARSC